jgi:VanZ family protein
MLSPAEAFSASCHSHRHTRGYWIIAVLGWTALIFFSSTSLAGRLSEEAFDALSALLFQSWHSAPGLYHPVHLLADKGVHVSLFAIFAVLLWNALPDSPHKLGSVILAGAVVGCGSEFLQRYFPGRDPALRDVCINAAATACGAVIRSAVFRSNRKLASTVV